MEAAFFDLDKTVIAKASMAAFGVPFYREGLISRTLLLRALYAQVVYLHLGADAARLARMRESVLALTKGWDQAQLRQIVAQALAEVVEPIIFGEALELMEEHRAAGRLVFIVSASPAEIVEPLGNYLAVDRVIASRACVDEKGRYTGEMEFYAYGANKVKAMVEEAATWSIDLSAAYAYSDSATDLPMLEAVGHPVAVNPDRDLARVARDRGWEIRHFVRPVRLRDRVPAPPPGPTAAVAAAAVAAAAVALLLWKRLHPGKPPPPTPVGLRRLAAQARRLAPSGRRPRPG